MNLRATGRLVGALFLLAFLCYGTGSAIADRSAGTALMLLNSVVVATLGFLAFRAVRPWNLRAASIYLGARGSEAVLLTAGVVLLTSAFPDAADSAYQLAMLSLGVGSLPFLAVLRRASWLPGWLATWGLAGYALLALGAVAELLGLGVGLALSIPGGLFEVVFGVMLLYRGFPEHPQEPIPRAAGYPDSAADASRLRRAALVAGLGLLGMAVLAGLANFGVLERLVNEDAAATTQNLLRDQGAFYLAIIGLSTVACLDVVVAWALWVFFDRVHHITALLGAWCRTAYAVFFGIAITHLVVAAGLLHNAELGTDPDRLSREVFAEIGRFNHLWQLALMVFGVHLLLVGWLAWRSRRVPRVIAVLVAVAGAGYLVDSIGPLGWAGYTIELSLATFVGEVVLMGWLLIYAVLRSGRRGVREEPAAIGEDDGLGSIVGVDLGQHPLDVSLGGRLRDHQ